MEPHGEPKTCARCGGNVVGNFRGLKLTVCCADCCEKARRESGFYFVSWREALNQCHCRVKDLKTLVCKKTNTPSCRCYRNNYYLLAEVQQLGRLRKAEQKPNQSVRYGIQDQALMRRKQNLLKSLNLDLRDFLDERNRTLMIFLIGDYLRRWKSQTKLEDVKKRWKALPRVREILQSCPNAHPGAVFDFCVAHPQSGAAEFRQLKTKIRSVFYTESRRILSYLSQKDLAALVNTPLRDEYMDFCTGDTRSTIQGHLLQIVSPDLAYDIMNRPNWPERDLCSGTCESRDAKRRCPSSEKRREKLEKAFIDRGLSLRLWSSRWQMYQ